MVTKRFPIQLLFRIKHWWGQYVITMDIMRVGFPSLVQAYSRYTAIKLLLFLPLPLAIKQGGFSSSGTFTYPISISRFLTGGVTSRMTSRNYDSDWGDIIRTPTSSYFCFRKNGYSDGSYCWLIGL